MKFKALNLVERVFFGLATISFRQAGLSVNSVQFEKNTCRVIQGQYLELCSKYALGVYLDACVCQSGEHVFDSESDTQKIWARRKLGEK